MRAPPPDAGRRQAMKKLEDVTVNSGPAACRSL